MFHSPMSTRRDRSDIRPPQRAITSRTEEQVFLGVRPNLFHMRTYAKGVELFSQGQLLDEVVYVANGWVKLLEVDGEGTEIIAQLACNGDWLGSASAIAGTPTEVSAVTCVQTQIAVISTTVFRSLLDKDTEFSLLIHKAQAHQLLRLTRLILQLSSQTSRQRLQFVMHEFIRALGTRETAHDVRVRMPLLHRELAQLIGVTPEHLSRLLKEIEFEGLIRRDKGWIVIPDVSRFHPACS